MPAKVTLTVTQGLWADRQFTFRDHTLFSIGRSEGCYLQVPNDWWNRNISRYHCLIDIDPPFVSVRDCGSKNGTYVNGHKIGQRGHALSMEQAFLQDQPDVPLKKGDEIKVGDLVLRVGIVSDQDDVRPRRNNRADSGTFRELLPC